MPRASRGAVAGWELEVEGWVNEISLMLYIKSVTYGYRCVSLC